LGPGQAQLAGFATPSDFGTGHRDRA
jgi:hypothetical protein